MIIHILEYISGEAPESYLIDTSKPLMGYPWKEYLAFFDVEVEPGNKMSATPKQNSSMNWEKAPGFAFEVLDYPSPPVDAFILFSFE